MAFETNFEKKNSFYTFSYSCCHNKTGLLERSVLVPDSLKLI